MSTCIPRLYQLKIVFVFLGLSTGLVLPVFSQPLLDRSQPASPDRTNNLARPLKTPKIDAPPRISPPAIPERPITVQSSLLPSGFNAKFPQFDGDGFFLVPSRTEATLGSANEVFNNAVKPFLSAIEFKDPDTRFREFNTSYRGRELLRADFESLAKITCNQWWIQNDKKAQQSCTALSKPTSAIKKAQERVEVEYFFAQERKVRDNEHPNIHDIPEKVPLEHTGIRVEGRKGVTGLFVTGRVINNDVHVSNVINLKREDVHGAASEALKKINGISNVSHEQLAPVELLLLPYDGTGGDENQPTFKYAYRTALVGDFLGLKGTFYIWLDADTGTILQLVPTMGSAIATGKTFLRDPSRLPSTSLAEFEVDNLTNGTFVLSRSGIFTRIDRVDALYDDGELKKTPADFGNPPINLQNPRFERPPMGNLGGNTKSIAVRNVACEKGHNVEFAQVDLMATISRYRTTFNSASPLLQFPRTPRKITLDDQAQGCMASYAADGFSFGICRGYTSNTCPNDVSFVNDDELYLNPAHDHTVVAHEFGHAFTQYQYGYPEDLAPATTPEGMRPSSWCTQGQTLEDPAMAPCPMPIMPDMFHDFADAWSQVLEDTNCVGGWFGKNQGKAQNFSLNCRHHSESGGMPRLSEVKMTFNPLAPGDHFPEHRISNLPGYADYSDMQIAGAALWAVREGLKKRDPAAGAALYLGRFVQTLATTGWFGQPTISNISGYTDRDIYRSLVELEVKLASRWAGNPGESTVNKVVSGFAQAGVFMIPWGCLTTPAGNVCDSGADAVIDVTPGKDNIARSGSRPTFHIWTGPLYKFDGTTGGTSSFKPSAATPSPCNKDFEVEIASDVTFTLNRKTSTPSSGVWRTVSNESSSGCHKTWKPSISAWNALKGTSGQTKVYYRVTTKKSGSNVRISTRPANGLFGNFDPPYLVVK